MTNMAHTVSGELQAQAEADSKLVTPARFPSHAERAKTVMYALGNNGRPLFALSDLAEHSKNLALDVRASLLVTEPPEGADALASGRVTLIGSMHRLKDQDREEARKRYLERHPHAYYVDFDDFDLYGLEVEAIRYVGGFGLMSWMDAQKYADAEPDPVKPAAHGIITHMNDDHADAVMLYAEVLAGIAGVTEATMTTVDRYGFDVVAQTAEGSQTVRITFDERLNEAGQVRQEMINLLTRARELKAGGNDAS